MLEQKSKHLAANLQLAKNTQTNDVNSEDLHNEVSELKARVNSLFDRSANNINKLESISEEDAKP